MIYTLNRFKTAQNEYYTKVLKELREGNNRTHCIWYIIQQKGLG